MRLPFICLFTRLLIHSLIHFVTHPAMTQHPLIAKLCAKPLGYEDESNRIWRETHENDNNGKMVRNIIGMKVPWNIKKGGSTSRWRLQGTERGRQTQVPTGARPAATSRGEGHQDLFGPNLSWKCIEVDRASSRLGTLCITIVIPIGLRLRHTAHT